MGAKKIKINLDTENESENSWNITWIDKIRATNVRTKRNIKEKLIYNVENYY